MDAILRCGGQRTLDGSRFRSGGGILWNILKTREPKAYKEIMTKGREFEVCNDVPCTLHSFVIRIAFVIVLANTLISLTGAMSGAPHLIIGHNICALLLMKTEFIM